jgi:Fe2+ transport system protein B
VHATMPSFFSTDMGSHTLFCLGWFRISVVLISASLVTWNDRSVPLAQLLVEMRSYKLPAWAGLEP